MKNISQILVIEDEPANREAIALLLGNAGYQVKTAESGENALELLKKNAFEVILTDLCLPGVSGIDILKKVKEDSPYTNVILITGKGSAESAVEAMKEGAFDYITKPLHFEKLQVLIAKALEKSRLVAENLYLRQQLRGKYRFDNMIGTSLPMQQVFSRMEKILNTDSTILILGESGTGKELVAKAIHFNGHRREKPFVAINCGAIPAELLESELFGHVRGSFTGAFADKEGKFKAADKGTIFLDEISSATPALQVKLLRVLQERQFEPVGSNKTQKVDVRVVLASNENLAKAVQAGRFRQDLFYRINVVTLQLPPLRERLGDIPLLADHFLKHYRRELKRDVSGFTANCVQTLQCYSWPGNVRELENVVERAVVLCRRRHIDTGDLPEHLLEQLGAAPAAEGVYRPTSLKKALEGPERQIIEQALRANNWNRQLTAQILEINRTTLYKKMKRYGLDDDPARH